MTEQFDDRMVIMKKVFEDLECTPEILEYYLCLRAVLDEQRSSGAVPLCDPRDVGMVNRLNETQWRPTVTLKLPNSDDSPGITSKQTAIDEEGDEILKGCGNDKADHSKDSSDLETFVCGVHGCNKIFSSLASYESHYYTCHNFTCSACKRIFVSNFLLDVHIEENHDSYFQALSSRLPMYRCLVETCIEKFPTDAARQDHLVKQHKFPHKFAFHRPIRPKILVKDMAAMEVTDEEGVAQTGSSRLCDESFGEVTDVGLNTKRNVVNKVPTTICFGRGSKKAFKKVQRSRKGQEYQWYHGGKKTEDTRVSIENIDMKDLTDSILDLK